MSSFDSLVSADEIRGVMLAVSELAGWPEVAALFPGGADPVRLDWQLPALACQAVGGPRVAAIHAAAATASLQISIILVDDILDNDPRGEFHRLGVGRAANLGLAFQSAAFALLSQANAGPAQRVSASAALARAALRTSYGQELDVQNLQGEVNYWRVVQAKSTPFYGGALEIGGWLGGAQPAVAAGLYEFGAALGQIIQLFDDLQDAFEAPPNPDWSEGRNNLLLLYAGAADHPQRERFLALRPKVGAPEALEEAQCILLSSGAVSYCVYLLLERHGRARRLLEDMGLPDPAPLAHTLRQQMAPLAQWLQQRGVELPGELQGYLE